MKLLKPPSGGPKMLVFDIETAPYLIESWGTFKTNALDIVQEWYLLCFAYAWYDFRTKTIGPVGWVGLPDTKAWKPGTDNDEYVARKLWKLLDEADIVIGQNHERFDIRKANERFFVHGWEPPAPYNTVDLKKHYRRSMMGSAALKYMARKAGVPEKMSHSGYSLWKGCMAGEPDAWREMREYNIQDVETTAALYVRMLPWIGRLGTPSHPNLGHYVDGEGGYVCPNCGNKERQHGGVGHQIRGYYYTAAYRYPKMRCNECGRYGKYWKAEKLSDQRSIIGNAALRGGVLVLDDQGKTMDHIYDMSHRTFDFTWQLFKVHCEGNGPIALDIETTIEENPWRDTPELISVALAFDEHRAFVFDAKSLERIRGLLQTRKFIMHNGLFDKLALESWFGYKVNLTHDTMAMQYLLDPDEPKGLQDLTIKYLGKGEYKNVDYKNIKDEPWEKVVKMNGEDAINTFALFRPLADQLNKDAALSRVYQWIIMPAINELIKITQTGIPLNGERLAKVTANTEKEVEKLLTELRDATPLPGEDVYPKGWTKPGWWRVRQHGRYNEEHPHGIFNPGSHQQVRHVLFDLWDLPPLEYTVNKDGEETDNPSTNADVLLRLETFHATGAKQEWLHKLRAYRKATKLLTYFHAWPGLTDEKGWLHPRYKPLHVVTGRLSSDQPNIQNVPRQKLIRSCFGDVEGYTWLKADYSQIELRLAAEAANEQTMLQAYRDGEDIHRLTAKLVLGDASDDARQVGKTLNFGLLYGAGAGTLQRIARSDYDVFLSLGQARTYRKEFFRAYPGLARWHQKAELEIETTGISRSPLGRIRYLPKAKIPSHVQEMWGQKMAAIREGINHRIQSFASDLLLMSLIRVAPKVHEHGALIVAEVHDEIDFLVPHENVTVVSGIVKETMEDISWLKDFGIKLSVPVLADVETGPNWGELE